MKEMTAIQQKVYDFVSFFIATEGMPPTRAEISRHFGWKSCNAAEECLQSMAKKGHVQIRPGMARGLRLLTKEMS